MSYSEEQIKELKGLSSAEVTSRQKSEGYNELPAGKKRTFFHIAFEVVKEPMFLLLVACGTIYLFSGEVVDALLLLGFVFVMMGITIYQEGKTENALEALRDLSSPRALVIRDGEQVRIAGREVVRGDIMILTEGDRVPADGVLLWGMNLTADESLLTGESIAVRKHSCVEDAETLPANRPGGDDLPWVYSGTLIVQGQAVALVRSIGGKTEMGKIGKALQSIEQESTMLQKQTGRLVRAIFIFAAALCLTVVIVSGLILGDWLKGLLNGLTLAMAMLPEEFPVVLTVFLALGAWRISQKQVLTRRIAAVETLGSATVLCSDKTGTLTQNKMSIKEIFANGKFLEISQSEKAPLPENFHVLIEYGILASKRDPFDAMEKALKKLGDIKLSHTEHLHEDWKLIHEYPLSRELLALSHVWVSPDEASYIISAKGAPEAIFDLCHLSKTQIADYSAKVQAMAKKGLRILGVARSSIRSSKNLPDVQHDIDFEFLGLIALEDPIRPTVPLAIEECYRAGIRVVMITGDYPVTASNIAAQIGLKNPDEIITGEELDKMDIETLKERSKTVNVYARVVPEQKLKLVNAFKAAGEVVAMTGDGVNDAPALKAAHIGVAMGERGTDVAREASALVLVNDDFSSIVAAVSTGRRIFDNLKKAMSYIVSVHLPIAGMSLIPVLIGWKEGVLLPIHIVFLELIIDPACSVVFEMEPEASDTMHRPPRATDEPLFGKRSLVFSILQGLIALAAVGGVFLYAIQSGLGDDAARTLAFVALIFSNIALILTNRSWSMTIIGSLKSKNPALLWVIGGTLLFLGLVVFVPFLRDIFHFAPVSWLNLLIAMGAGILSVFWFEIVKIIAIRKKIQLLKDSS
ncbi:MAG: ATPase [Spirochaetes bacterium GWF1_51_8]|nr:MAG: ATPase [Spirochaetes bacterium GWF1_51_8]